jgi:hypothetical protein
MAGGQYKLMFERLLGPLCDIFYEEHMRFTVEEFYATTNLTSWTWGQCPALAGDIFINNYMPSQFGDYLPAYLPGGEKWKGEFYYVDKDKNIIGGTTHYAILRSNYSLLRYGG